MLAQLQEGKVLLIDKPLDWTSFDVVNKIRWEIRKKYQIKKIKVGHAGTLDPKATGLLLICIGKETRHIEMYQATDKVYSGTLKLGVITPSYDTETAEQDSHSIDHLSLDNFFQQAETFKGVQWQIPPIFSAVKHEGKRLYELARKGIDVPLNPRQVAIHDFTLQNIDLPLVDFRVCCGKGTYIRSLVHDFGQALQCGAYLTALRRERIGDFDVKEAYTIAAAIDKIRNEDW